MNLIRMAMGVDGERCTDAEFELLDRATSMETLSAAEMDVLAALLYTHTGGASAPLFEAALLRLALPSSATLQELSDAALT